MAVVSLNNVVKSYNDTLALNKVNLETRDGEFFILLGPSGAGKTTILKVIAGLEEIDSGTVSFDGKDVITVLTNKRDVGMAFESYALYPLFTVYENLAYPLRVPSKKLSKTEISKRVMKMAKLLKIDHLLERRPGELSGGQKQRVSLGRTMVSEPSIYLLDEPLTHVDARIRFDLRIQFHRLEELQKSTTIYVTHDYVEALSLGDRIGIINEGKILQVGTPKEIYYHPKNVFVAQLVGQPPINLLEASIETNSHGHWLYFSEGDFTISLSAKKLEQLKKAGDLRTVMVGIRPADISLTTAENGDVKAICDVFEPLGSVGLLSVMIQDKLNLEVLVDPNSTIEPDSELNLTFCEERMIFFDPVSKNNILRSNTTNG